MRCMFPRVHSKCNTAQLVRKIQSDIMYAMKAFYVYEIQIKLGIHEDASTPELRRNFFKEYASMYVSAIWLNKWFHNLTTFFPHQALNLLARSKLLFAFPRAKMNFPLPWLRYWQMPPRQEIQIRRLNRQPMNSNSFFLIYHLLSSVLKVGQQFFWHLRDGKYRCSS